jgi:outer membrane protein TolC
MRVLLLSLCLLSAAATAQPLSLAEAQALAQQRSRQPAAQASMAAAAREMAVAASRRPDPVLRLGVNNLPIEGPDRFRTSRDFMTMRSIGVMQELTRKEKLAARSRRFEQEALAAEAGSDAARLAVRRDAALAWVDLHYRQRALDLVRRQHAEAKLQEDAALAGVRAGRGAQADVVAARQAVAQLDDRIAETEHEVEVARIALARWVGEAATRPLAGAPQWDQPVVGASDMAARVAAHPRLRALQQQEGVAEAEIAAASAERRPDWSVELMYSQRGAAFGDMMSVNLSVPLQTDRVQRQDREVAARRANLERVRDEREEALRAAVSEARATLATWQGARARLARYDATLLPLAADRVQAALAGYRGAGASLATVLEARRAELDTRLERLRLERETARLAVQLQDMLAADTGATR